MTHSLQVLTHRSCTSLRRVDERCAHTLTEAYHSYTDTLLGVVEEEASGPSSPPVKVQENTALLNDYGHSLVWLSETGPL